MDLKLEQVMVGHEEWCNTNVRVNTRIQANRQELEQSQKSAVDVEANFDDINKIFEEKGQGPHMLLIDFEPTTETACPYPSNRVGKDVISWIWKHKLTGAEVRRYPTHSGKGYDTGVFSKYLKSLKATTHKVAYNRAQLILSLNNKKSVVDLTLASSPTKPVLSREVLLKQWVRCPVCVFYFQSYTPADTFFISVTLSLRLLCCRCALPCSVSNRTVQLSACKERMPFVSFVCLIPHTCHRIGLRL
jgi:hypothetical protein